MSKLSAKNDERETDKKYERKNDRKMITERQIEKL
jgi:hypothetical protein